MNVKSSFKSSRWLAAVTLCVLATPIHADTPAFELGSVSPEQPLSFTGTRGWQFVRNGANPADMFITQLGVFDSGGDGLVNMHQVGLWSDHGTGQLLASATVPAGMEAPLDGGYRWVPIAPVRIPFANARYVVGAQYSAGDADDLVTPYAGSIAVDLVGGYSIVGRGVYSTDLAWPSAIAPSPCPECPPIVFWEPNFQYSFVPEPSVWLLLVPGLLFLLWRHRKCMNAK